MLHFYAGNTYYGPWINALRWCFIAISSSLIRIVISRGRNYVKLRSVGSPPAQSLHCLNSGLTYCFLSRYSVRDNVFLSEEHSIGFCKNPRVSREL